MKLAADVIDRPLPYGGRNSISHALARDPALRSIPSDGLGRRFNVPRSEAEGAIRSLASAMVGSDPGPIVGRSFDEVISDAGQARRDAHSPLPLNEAAGFASGYDAGASAAERMYARRAPPGRASFVRGAMPPGRSSFARGAMGYQTPPIPDLACVLLSDAFPVTRRTWSDGDQPTQDEINILDWQHPLVTQASSTQSIATLKAISQGCRSWSKQVTIGGNQLSPRSSGEQVTWWTELQQIMHAVATNNVVSDQGGIVDMDFRGQWGLLPPDITADWVKLQYWDVSDASHPRLKCVWWSTKKLLQLGSGESVIDATWAKYGGKWEIKVDGDQVKWHTPEGWDFEKDAMKMLAGLSSTIQGLTTAISAAVAAYCPACAVAIKIAGNLALNASRGAVTTKALASYGDQMLTDASVKAMRGDASSLNALRSFAGALIGLPAGSQQGAQPNGGLVWDYLATLGTSYGNVPSALYGFALDRTNKIQNAADLATAAQVPLLDAQYAVAAMTDTLSRFASNVSTIYMDPGMSAADVLLHMHAASRNVLNVRRTLQNLPLVPGTQTPPTTGPSPVLIAGAALGAAWYLGLLKGLL